MKTQNSQLTELFIQNKGYVKANDLAKNRTLYDALNELIEENQVVKIKAGLYKHLYLVQENEEIEVSKMYPQGVLCLFSAWYHYNLSTHIPSEYHLAFTHKQKITIQDYPPIKAYYWSDKLYNLEVQESAGVKIYSLEKSVCDAVKFRNKIGIDVMSKILKNYIKHKDKNLNVLFQVSRKMRMELLLREYLTLIQ
jgi:predicted transcriptional regulator of viral defense system